MIRSKTKVELGTGEHNLTVNGRPGILSVAGHIEFEFESNRGGRCLSVHPRPLERGVSQRRLDLARTIHADKPASRGSRRTSRWIHENYLALN